VINTGFFDKIPFVKKKNSEDNSYSFANNNLGLDNGNIDFDRTGIPQTDVMNSEDNNLQQVGGKMDFDRAGLPTHESFSSQDTSALDQAGFDANNPSSIESFKQTHQSTTADKELELISAKLDTIKLILDNLDRRIANLEKIAKE